MMMKMCNKMEPNQQKWKESWMQVTFWLSPEFTASAVSCKTSAFHREFKIKGAIGEAGQRDKLPYISMLK